MSDLLYLDYFNGMMHITNNPYKNINTMRLYKDNATNGNETILLCSAPFTGDLRYSINNTYNNTTAGLIGTLLEQFAHGVKEGEKLLGGAMMIGSQVTNLIDKFTNSKAGFLNFMKNDAFKNEMTTLLADSGKAVVMPWKETKLYNQSKINVELPSIDFTVVSSKSLTDYLNGIFSKKYKSDKIVKTLSEGSPNSKNVNYDGTPVKKYIDLLIKELGGRIETKGNKETPFAINFTSPTSDSLATKMQNALNGYNLDNYEKGLLWLSIGDEDKPIIIKNLVPLNITVEPSKQLTPNNDFLYARIKIGLDFSQMLVTNMFNAILNPIEISNDINTKKTFN